MSIDSFYQSISRAIRRGKVYDEDIPGYVQETVRQLEDMHNLKHMYQEFYGVVITGADDIRFETGIGSSPSLVGKIKDIRHIALIADNGDEYPLKKTRRENVINRTSGRPGAYWMEEDFNGHTRIGLDNTADKGYSYVMVYYEYSIVPLINSLGFLANGPDLLRAMTLVNMAPVIRDDKLTQRWGRLVDVRLPQYLEAQIVHEEDGIENQATPFVDQMAEDNIRLVEF
jgi:hypothetical protein